MRILLVEDDAELAVFLKKSLTRHHYQVDWAKDGEEGLEFIEIEFYDLILLDLYLPKLSGSDLCQYIRTYSPLSTSAFSNQDTPILLLTGETDTVQKVLCLDAGADDYVVKPVDLDELLARLRALLRRGAVRRSPLLQWGDVQLDPRNGVVTFRQQVLPLTSKEYALLKLFLQNPEQIFSPARIIERLWSVDNLPTEAAVRAHIKALRQKLRQAGAEDLFETQYKMGYRLKPLTLQTQKSVTPSNSASES